jgi:hypothetical protein
VWLSKPGEGTAAQIVTLSILFIDKQSCRPA